MFNQNFVSVVGKLVSNSLELKTITPKDGKPAYEAMTGKIVVRVADKSEIEVDAFAKRYTNAGTESQLFTGLVTVAQEHNSIAKMGSEELADTIKVSGCGFNHNDYKSKKDGLIKTVNGIKASFFKRLEAKDLETEKQEATFSCTGMITKIEDKLTKGVATGDKIITLDVVEKQEGKNGNPDYYSMVPVKLFVDKSMAGAFLSAGFSVGQGANLAGHIVNIETKTEQIVKRDFGADEVRVFTNYDKRNIVTGGSVVREQKDICFTPDQYKELVAKRNLKLSQLENKNVAQNSGGQANPFGGAPSQDTPSNPFGGASTNPFA